MTQAHRPQVSRRTLQHTALALATMALCGAVQAQGQVQGQDSAAATAAAKALPSVTVTATLNEQDARTAPASVTVIDREELANRNATDLLDAVRGAPGLTLSPRQVGGRKTLALRGLEGKHTLTLIDGRRISASDDVVGHSDYQYGWLPMSAIERIEVIRGPMSALYGSEALGGVVNLITRQPKDRWMGSVSLSGSNPTNSSEGESTGTASVFATGPVGERLTLRVNGEVAHSAPVADRKDARNSEIEGRHSQAGAWLPPLPSMRSSPSRRVGRAALSAAFTTPCRPPKAATAAPMTSTARRPMWAGRGALRAGAGVCRLTAARSTSSTRPAMG